MRAESSAMRSPSRSSLASASPGAGADAGAGEASDRPPVAAGCAGTEDETGPSQVVMAHCNPMFHNGLRAPWRADRRALRGSWTLGARTGRLWSQRRVRGHSGRRGRRETQYLRRTCQVQSAGRGRIPLPKDPGTMGLSGAGPRTTRNRSCIPPKWLFGPRPANASGAAPSPHKSRLRAPAPRAPTQYIGASCLTDPTYGRLPPLRS